MMRNVALALTVGAFVCSPALPQKTAGTPNRFGSIPQQPWYSSPGVQQQLKLNANQTARLNKAWTENWTRYNTQMSELPATPNEQSFGKRYDYMSDFNKGFSTASRDVLAPQQQQRFNQLYWQYQGSNAFYDPQVQQKLNLTAEQQQKLRQHSMDLARSDNVNQSRQQDQQWIGTFLTDQQQQMWRQMIGDPYSFSTTNPNQK